MEVFRDLLLHGDTGQIAATSTEIERRLCDGWSRDAGAEASLRLNGAHREPVWCFVSEPREHRPAATVFVTRKEPMLFHVPNVLPRGRRDLSRAEYNALLAEFHDRFVRPAAEATGVRVELTVTQADLGRWLSPAAVQKLRTFSATADRATGAARPADHDRWLDFIVTAHRDGTRLDALTLRRWLTEVDGWPPEVAERLTLEYEVGQQILAFSDGRRSA